MPEHHPVAAPRELASETVDGIAGEGAPLAFHSAVDAKAGTVDGDRPLPAGRALDAEARTHHVLLEHVEVHRSVEGELAEGAARRTGSGLARRGRCRAHAGGRTPR